MRPSSSTRRDVHEAEEAAAVEVEVQIEIVRQRVKRTTDSSSGPIRDRNRAADERSQKSRSRRAERTEEHWTQVGEPTACRMPGHDSNRNLRCALCPASGRGL